MGAVIDALAKTQTTGGAPEGLVVVIAVLFVIVLFVGRGIHARLAHERRHADESIAAIESSSHHPTSSLPRS